MLTAERARELLVYNPETGIVTWASMRSRSRVRVGDRAGTVQVGKTGYRVRQIRVDGKIYKEHRLIWLLMKGVWPNPEIDHEDHDATNNVWTNLKEATRLSNCKNHTRRSDNRTGVTGVSRSSRRDLRKPFVAKIQVKGKTINLGYFGSLEEAAAARKAADNQYDFHTNHGSETKGSES